MHCCAQLLTLREWQYNCLSRLVTFFLGVVLFSIGCVGRLFTFPTDSGGGGESGTGLPIRPTRPNRGLLVVALQSGRQEGHHPRPRRIQGQGHQRRQHDLHRRICGRQPLPGVKFLGPEWRELFRHAVKEAERLKIEMGFNLAGGWVMIGPWVTPDNAMKKVVQAEVKLQGPKKFSGKLPQPETVDGYYRDVMVQAFRSRDKATPIDPKEIIDMTDRWHRRTVGMGRARGRVDDSADRLHADRQPMGAYPDGRHISRRRGLSDRLPERGLAGRSFRPSRARSSSKKRRRPAGGWPISGPTVGNAANSPGRRISPPNSASSAATI